MSFGDVRVAERAEWLIDRVAATGSLVVRKLGETRAGEMAAHRFLSSPFVSVDRIVDTLARRTAEACRGRRVLAVQDTSEINFAGRSGRRRGFGPAGDGCTPGFFVHPVIAVDVESEAVLGLVDAAIWTRPPERAAAPRSRPFDDRESARWLRGCEAAAVRLDGCASLTMVADRESDVFAVLARRPAGLDLIVRAAQDRGLAGGGRLFGTLGAAPSLGHRTVRIAPRGPGDTGRVATVAIRAARVSLARPQTGDADDLPASLALNAVEAREVDPPPGASALLWRLLTTLPLDTEAAADEVVQLYRLRWRIEQTFRALKGDGLALDDSQLVDAERLFNLAALGLAGAVRTIQLVDARHGSPRPATDVVDEAFAPALRRISQTLEGRTERQKNHHPPGSLAFVAWIAARLGGWNCYYKPPGPKTMRDGWNRLAERLQGYAIAMNGTDP